MAPTDTYPQHVVTAVIVAHDGAAWLPHVLDALLEQTRPVQRVVAVDTGSRDRSGAVLAAQLGQGVVFGMERTTGYGAAVARALQHQSASTPVPAGPGAAGDEPVEWVWLLHDDCEPAPDALEQLLRGAAETPRAAVLGPKVMDWSDRDVLLEAGLTIDSVGRRVTGIEPREVDQGQHDGDRDTLAVGSAGMLVRRDVWDQLRGFDPAMTLFREDIDFCWRVHAAGYRVRVITDAMVYHAQAIARRRRAVSVGRRGQLLDRRNALLTLAGNLPAGPMLRSLAGNVTVSVLRALFFLVAKRVTAALDETAAVLSVVAHPLRLRRVRQARARGRKAAYARLRADLPPGRSVRRIAEFVAAMSSSAQQDTHGSHHATEDPDADDFLLTDTGFAQRILTSPAVLLFVVLLVVTGIAERSVLGAGILGGGALLPATQGAAGLWHSYLQGFHPTGIGSPSITPPYLAIVAVLATVLLGKAWLAVDLLLLGSVPIAGMAAYRAARQVTASVPVRVWAGATYALIPVASGAISAGRLGTATAFAAIPVIGLLTGRMFRLPPRLARRAAWAAGLVLALGTAFVPLLWPIALLAAVAAAVALRDGRPDLLRNLGVIMAVPVVLLVPWTFQLLAHPSTLLLEAGVQQAGLATRDLPATSLLLLSPGGPGLPPAWVMAGLALAGLLPLLAARRRTVIMAGWTVALIGLVVAVVASRLSVRPPAGGAPVTAWPGVALAVTAAGLLVAAAAGADALGRLLPGNRGVLRRLGSARGLGIAVVALAACSAPVLAGGFWLLKGVTGPLGADSGQVVPALVSASSAGGAQVRTLVLSTSGPQVSYLLLRGSGPALGDADVTPVPAAESALRSAVAVLVSAAGGQVADQGQLLARFDIGFVLMRAPVNAGLARTLDSVAGLRRVSITPSFDLWRLGSLPARVSVVEPGGTVAALPSGPLDVSGAAAPAAGGILTVAEPAGGWHASLNGRPLTEVASPAGSWAQAFRLPSGGGTVQLGRSELWHDLGIGVELLAVLVIGALALPGVRTAAEAQLAAAGAGVSPAAAGAGAAGAGAGAGGPAGADDTSDETAAGIAGRPAARAGARAAGRDSDRHGGKGRSRSRGGGRRGRKPGAEQPLTGAGPIRPVTGRRAARDLAGSGDFGAGRTGASTAGGGRGAPGGEAGSRHAAGAPAAWPAGQPSSRFFNDAPRDPERPEPGYDAGDPETAGFGYGAPDQTVAFDRGAPSDSTAASDRSPDLDSTAAFDRSPDLDSTAAFDRSTDLDSTAAFDASALRGAGSGRGDHDSGEHATGEHGTGEYGSRQYGSGEYSRPDLGRGEYASDQYASGEYPSGEHGTEHVRAEYASGEYASGEYASGEFGRAEHVSGEYGRPGYAGADYAGSAASGRASGQAGPGRDGYRSGEYAAPDRARTGYGAAGYGDSGGYGRPGAGGPDGRYGPAAGPDDNGSGRAAGGDGYGRPDDDGPGYREDAGAPGRGGLAGRAAGPGVPGRSAAGDWPYADNDSLPGGPRPSGDPASPARLSGRQQVPGQQVPGQRRPGDSLAAGRPGDGVPPPGSYSASSSWPDTVSPRLAAPPPSRPAQPRPDPGWPDDRWPDARQRGEAAPEPAAPSGGWPEPDAQAAWPDSVPPAAWPADPPPQAPGWPGGDWPGAGDSLEPLPSDELHHGGATGPGADEQSRRRWPAPEPDEDEGDRW